jgi:uncharacterized protein (TIGR03083 family)
MSDAHLQASTIAERERLTEILARLTPQQWETASLCAGWRVREVVAHLSMPFRTKPPRLLLGLVAARFSFNRYADAAAHKDAAYMTDEQLLDAYRDNIANPWQPPGGGAAGALSHDVIHGLDITEPLDLDAAPTDRIAAVLSHVGPRNLAYFGVNLAGIQLRATDADVCVGSGEPLTLSAKEMLLAITGRRPVPRTGTAARDAAADGGRTDGHD